MPGEGRFRSPAALSEQRTSARRILYLQAQGTAVEGKDADVVIQNLSPTGLLLKTEANLALDEEISVDLPLVGSTIARIIWSSGNLFGCEFQKPIPRAALSAAQLQSSWRVAEEINRSSAVSTSEAFPARLKRLRKQKGLTVTQLAKMVGVSRPTVWNWESGNVRPQASRLDSLAEALGVANIELIDDGGMKAGTVNPITPSNPSVGDQDNKSRLGKYHFDRPTGSVTRLQQLIAASKQQIADLTGTGPEKVTIVVEF